MNKDAPAEDGEASGYLPIQWRTLIDKLWSSNEKSIVDFIPEIVAIIKSTRKAADAERGLLTLFSSPTLHRLLFELDSPAIVSPATRTHSDFADAVNFPLGKQREYARFMFTHFFERKALSVHDGLSIWETMASATGIVRPKDEASAERAKRARRRLGITRPSGRPKRTEQK